MSTPWQPLRLRLNSEQRDDLHLLVRGVTQIGQHASCALEAEVYCQPPAWPLWFATAEVAKEEAERLNQVEKMA
jgi:hypothetical protein